MMRADGSDEVPRPVDLARYEQTEDQERAQAENEAQQLLEPPYGQMGVAQFALDEGTRRMVSEGEAEISNPIRGRSTEVSEVVPAMAKLSVRPDQSPSRRSGDRESLYSVHSMPSASKLSGDGIRRMDADDRELIPDYSALLSPPVETPMPTSNPNDILTQQVLAQMGAVVQQVLQSQVAPTLNQMMVHQAKVESRLERLEAVSRPVSMVGDAVRERALLDSYEDVDMTKMGVTPQSPRGLQATSSAQQVITAGTANVQTQHVEHGKVPSEGNNVATDSRSGNPGLAGEGLAQAGEVVVGGVLYAWQLGAGGLVMVPKESQTQAPPQHLAPQHEPHPSAHSSGVTAGDIFRGRASSPFQRYHEPGTGSNAQISPITSEPRALKPGPPDPVRPSSEDKNDRQVVRWVPDGGSGNLVVGNPGRYVATTDGIPASPPVAPQTSPRYATPTRPRIVYPISPGGTEIKPPPQPRTPNKRSTKASPSPPRIRDDRRGDTDEPPQQSEVQRLTAAIEGAIIRSSRGSEPRVEDVKSIPELPKLEVKDNEKDLTPLIAGDWLALVGPSMRDLSATASTWWSEVTQVSQEYYGQWLSSTPIDRISLKPSRPDRFDSGPYTLE